METIKDLLKENERLLGSNANQRNYFQDLADYNLPRKAWQNTPRYKGDRLKFNFLYDSTAMRALKNMAAGMHANLTNPSSKWFNLQTRNLNLMDSKAVQMWFKEVEDIEFSVFNNSNFDTTMQEFYMDFGCFGTAGILTMDDPKTKVRYSTLSISKINFVEDADGRVIKIFTNFKLSAEQAFRKWGGDVGKSVRETYADKPSTMFDFVHYVGPREDRDVTRMDSKNMAFKSVWIAVKDQHLIQESGFFENPYAIGRFYKDSESEWGFSPAMDVLADVKLINAMKRTLLRAGMKQADPPMQAPSKGYMMPLNLNPAAMNYRDPKTQADSLQPINVGAGNLPITLEILQMVQNDIKDGMFWNVFRTLSEVTKQMTVPEVQRRVAEAMIQLGPVVGRCTHEVLDAVVIRTFNILFRSGELPPPPEEIQGEEMDVVYLGPLARAQRESDMYAIESFLGTVAQIATVKPGALDKVDEDKAVDIIADIKGIDPRLIRDDAEVEEIRTRQAEGMAAQAKLVAAQQGMDLMKTGAEADALVQKGAK